jgi:very-short-patch-repair endonuclease
MVRYQVAQTSSADAIGPGDLRGWDFFRRYARHASACLAEEERGSVDVFADRILERLALLVPERRWWPEAGEALELEVALDSLHPELRAALARREAADVALGWGLRVRQTRVGPVASPLVTLPTRFTVVDGRLVLAVEAVPPDLDLRWVRRLDRPQRRRLEGWLGLDGDDGEDCTRRTLLDLRTLGGRLGLFLGCDLPEPLNPSVLGRSLRVPDHNGCRNVLGLFLLDPARYAKGAVADLAEIGSWDDSRLAATSLSALVSPTEAASASDEEISAVVEAFELGESQLAAVRDAAFQPLTVITGPPGTGKSQAAAAILLNAALHGQSALLASRNHKALDAVEERLETLSSTAILIRLSRPAGQEASGNIIDALHALLARPAGGAPRTAITRAVSEIDKLDAERQRLLLEQAEIELQAHELAGIGAEIIELEEELGARSASRLGDLPELEWLPRTEPAQAETWPLIGSWLRRRRLGRILRGLPALDWSQLGRPVPTIETVTAALEQLERLRRWQRANKASARVEAWLRNTRPADTRRVELADLNDKIRQATRRLVSDLWPDAMATVDEATHEALARFRDQLRYAEADAAVSAVRAPGWAAQGHLLLHQFPLWGVTNLSARSRIPLVPGLFDLLVLDEASQCDIPSALPLLARAKRAVVIGDPAQLGHVARMSPQREVELLRRAGLATDSVGGWLTTCVSLFELARGKSGARHLLRDHFRCQAEIADYISRNFYGGQLNVLTPAERLRPPPGLRPGLMWQDSPGPIVAAGHGCHAPGEAKAIVERLHDLLIAKGWRGTVAVTTPFAEQAKRIGDLIAREIPGDVIVATDLVASTVHQLQGDARDLIFVSLCLGSDTPRGSVEFLRRERRLLNVAVSRARAACCIVGNRDYARGCGVDHIEELVKAATTPSVSRERHGEFQSPWERRLHDALVARGVRPIPQYPLAGRFLDLALIGSERRLDIEVDGDAWHRDADGRRRQSDLWRDHQITGLGWDVMRFWVYELRDDLDGCVNRIIARV